MVFKVSKGGVRSGNTLRGLNSNSTKRYGRHACLLGHTSLGKRDLTRLIRDSSDENELVSDTLSKTDVLLSLNKHQRWRLPAMIGQMIKAGDFNKGAVVSMLEKHKLKRRANCVSLVSNNARMSNIAPKNNKYFSFSLDSAADVQSKRERRRNRAEELKRLKVFPNSRLTKKGKLKSNNVVQVFTADGVTSRPLPKATEETTGVESAKEKPEYRLEVFYPCPRSCSLTYNPKYTDVSVLEGKTGELEVKSNVKTQKKVSATHRRRFTSRELERLNCDEIDDDVNKMWDDCENNDDVKTDETDDLITYYYQHPDPSTLEFAMDTLISQAKKAKDLCVLKKDFVQKKSKKKSTRVSICEDEKSHIVFVDSDGKEDKSDAEQKFVSSKTSSNGQGNLINDKLEYFRVILPTSEVSPEELKQSYGSLYAEASCQPRRFVLDVTDDIANLLATYKSCTKGNDFSSYLVFVYDGFYDNGLAAYKVALNSMAKGKMENLIDVIPFAKTSIPNIMNALVCVLLDLKEKNCLEFVERNFSGEVKSDSEFLNSRMKLKVEVFDPSSEMSKMAIASVSNEKTTIDDVEYSMEMMDEEDLFCDVCYDNVTSSRIDSVSGTKLKSCGHLLCDECWASHFRTSISEGRTTMACAGYDCNTKVGSVTLMSILNVSEVALLLKRQTEEELETMENAKWCPHPGCGRVIKVDSKSQDLCVDVNCACGNKLCFTCLGPAHWPARCDQAEEYMEKLPSLTPAKEYVEEESKPITALQDKTTKKPVTVKIEGRLCPRCKKFIEKNGGCPYMVCKCGFQMCWICMKPYHSSACKPDNNWVLQHTRILLVKHAVTKNAPSPVSHERPKIQKNKQKASLYQRALQQREAVNDATKYKIFSNTSGLVSKMVKASQKDPEFKREIMALFSKNNQQAEDESTLCFDVNNHLKNFIRTIVKMKKEMHRVREYTFILLQGTQNSVAKQRILKLANDLNGFCSFVTSILDLQDNQDAKLAFRRLVDLQRWAERALDALIETTKSLRMEKILYCITD